MKAFEIIDRLHISGKFDEEEAVMVAAEYDVVVNLWWKPDNFHTGPKDQFVYIHYSMSDGRLHGQEEYIRKLSYYIADMWTLGKRILIHCYGGRNRSALLAAMVLLTLGKFDKEDVIGHIKSIRKSAFSNKEYERFLDEYTYDY